MRALKEHTGLVAVLNKNNIDTDQIIPKQFLTSLEKTGFGDYLFDSWRFHDEGYLGKKIQERQEKDDFVLNQIRQASILIAGENFGCGSSREHAAWALLGFGIQVVIALSFADIFYANAGKNGLFCIALPENEYNAILQEASGQAGYKLTISLPRSCIITPSKKTINFTTDEATKYRIENGLDDIATTLTYKDNIASFETKHKALMPWLFRK